ncbi:hypothetical protein LepocDRAFT_00005290 [Leptothrix ochracea L12]|uniref:Uncharacterized protein n=2 Tax=Leptothrix ochracea TaxID=735331 RepID=I4Z6E5_9BURK|nr:hypothetical protein LepocDRAFT_00005290 [Leptothrix ochracea L12]
MYGTFAKILTLIGLTILVIVFSANPLTAPIKDGLTFPAVMASLGGIFVIVLLVERVTEIAITIWRQSDADELKTEIENLTKDATKAAELLEKQKCFAKYQAETKSIALLIGFTISIVVCCAGVGLLGAVIDITKGNPNFLRGVDILLTSGLIAGGSDSFHKFVSTLETFFNESKSRMERKP